MSDDPFTMLVVEALNLMHPRFARADGIVSFQREFYHQFRHLWDRALPVQLGLGHVVLQADPQATDGRSPDFLFWKLGEQGAADARLGAVSCAQLADPTALDDTVMNLARARKRLGYPHAICVAFGRSGDVLPEGLQELPAITILYFDLERWRVIA